MENIKTILVPWDFTENANFSLLHAKLMSDTMRTQIYLLHIISKDSEHDDAKARMEEVVELIEKEQGFKPKFLIKKGKVFKTISSAAIELRSVLIVMGLHSSKKSHKVLIGSKVPYLLVQKPPSGKKIADIVVPIDTDDSNRVQLNWVVLLAKYFDSSINIIKPFINSNYKNRLMKNNIQFAKQIMNNKEVIYGIKTAKRDEKFNHSINVFATQIEADLIFIMSTKFKDYMKGAIKQEMKIPVFCINPRTDLMVLPDKR